MGLLLYFPVNCDSRAASSSYNKRVSSCVRLCQVCWDHGVPSARRRRGLVLVSLKDWRRKRERGKSSGYVEGGPRKQLSRDLGVSGGMKDLCMSKTGERWKTSRDVLGHGQHHSVPSATCVHSHFGSSAAVSMRQMLHLVPPSIPNPSWMLLRAVSPPCTSTSDSGSFL